MPNSPNQSSETNIPDNPNQQLGFEINPQGLHYSFIPEFYPSDFTQGKEKKLNRYGGGSCGGGESVSIKTIKNRDIHVSGLLLQGEINVFNALLDLEGKVEVLSPLIPNGGVECIIKSGELGNESGYDPQTRERMFEYTLDLVSTGRDEQGSSNNAIVTALTTNAPGGTVGYR
jgi:hypothetical protein